jgi:osmotically-inducible protein OsmY
MPSLLTSPTSLQKSNVLAGYYANPMAMGLGSGSGSSVAAFGSPTFGNSTTNRNTTTGRGGLGGGLGGGLSGSNNSSNQSGIVIPVQSQMNYAASLSQMRLPAQPVAAARIQTDIRATLDGTSLVPSAKGVVVLTDKDNNVTLRGTVADPQEAQLIEGIVRLTPGVGAIKNELKPAVSSAGR